MESTTPTLDAAATRSEFGQLFRLAWPLMGAQLAQMGMGVLDTVMAGRLSAVDLAGVALGGTVMWPTMLLMMGVIQAVTPTVSQLNGARRHHEIGEVIRQALWMALLAATVICLVITHARPWYQLMEVDPAAVEVAVPYLAASAWGIPALMGYFVLRFLVEGLGFTRPAMIIAVSALILKIPLNYVFMYGAFGLPELGGVGCGVATAIIMWFEVISISIFVLQRRFDYVELKARFSWPRWTPIKRLLIIGIPIGATVFFEVGLFSLTTVLLGRFGADVVASHTIAMNLGGITFMFPLALGIAATIRVGFNVGSGQPLQARRTAAVAIGSTVTLAAIAAILVVAFRGFIASLYTTDADVRALASVLMLFVAVFQLFDNCQATAIGALRGYKDTRTPMFITLVGYWLIGLPIGCTLGYGWLGEPMGVYGFWVALVIALATVAISVCARLWWLSRNETAVSRLAGL